MAELSFKSPGVSVREIDLSGPTKLQPSGIPAGVIGTAVRGPAFVPITVATFQDFISKFGNTDGEKFGPLAMNEWLKNARAGTYVRVLGVGDGKARLESGNNQGSVNKAGFVVGSELVQDNGTLEPNTDAIDNGPLGRTYFIGAFMSESAGSTYLQDSGITEAASNTAIPLLRGCLMVPSGVIPGLSSSVAPNNTVSTTLHGMTAYGSSSAGDAGAYFGDVDLTNGNQDFKLFLNGHKVSSTAGNTINASFDPKAAHYFTKVLNTDPAKLEELGHYLYAAWDIDATHATVTGSGITAVNSGNLFYGSATIETAAFLLSGSGGSEGAITKATSRNSGSATTTSAMGSPNFDGFEDRFATAFSPYVISQKFGGKHSNLFRFHALDDGAVGGGAYKITVENVQASKDVNSDFGSFDVLVRKFDDNDNKPVVLESYRGLNLNPSSERYVARVIGDTNTFYDFDKKDGGQKLVIEGLYPNASQFVRIELSDALENGTVDNTAIPLGYRGVNHLVTSGSTSNAPLLATGNEIPWFHGNTVMYGVDISADAMKRVVTPPVPMRENLGKGAGAKKRVNAKLCWGIQWELKDDLTEPNKNQKIDPSLYSFTKWFPDYHTDYQNPWVGNNEGTPDVDGTVLDADKFNNNIFSLDRVEVITGSNNKPDARQWQVASYRRNGSAAGTMTDKDGNAGKGSRMLDAALDFTHLPSRKYLKFTLPLQGGFDGTNIFNEDKSKFTDAAIRREMDDSNQGVAEGPTVSAYRKAILVMEEKSDVDIQLLAIPGARHSAVTDFAIESVERRFDAMYIMDVEERDTMNSYVTGSGDDVTINVTNTTTNLINRALDTSFAAAYFPDTLIKDPATGQNVQCPPSVSVLGALALNDRLSHPWFAPAGFTRGALDSVIESKVKLNRANLDELYSADINPLVAFPHTRGTIVFGQKTLLAAQSSLDRVNVRRLLIDIRRKVKAIANTLLFEPNRASTLASFSAAVSPILNTIQQQQGLSRFKVQIDTSTTTQADVENNTIRGKIFLQPTRAVEFISLDFVVTNAGNDI